MVESPTRPWSSLSCFKATPSKYPTQTFHKNSWNYLRHFTKLQGPHTRHQTKMHTQTQHAQHTPGTDFGQQKETLTVIYKQYIRSVLEYASPAWAPNLAITHHNALQTIQNNALRIIAGCTQTTPTNHLHCETQVLTLQDHINMRGTQFLAAASANPDHPCHYMLEHQPTPCNIKTTPQALYTRLLNTLVHTSTRTSQT